jgi:glycosyltransferase involved in cell wall biosynthesis
MNTVPKISIILPTYNRAEKIKKAVGSVINQSYQNWELIIIDDASTDNTPEVLDNLKAADKRIICLHNERNLGLAQTPNKGLAVARGEYIARIDDDDEWVDINKLKKQLDYMENHRDCILVGTAFEVVKENGSILRIFKPILDDKKIRNHILSVNPFGHSTVLFRKAVMADLGGYDENLGYTEDYDLWLRLGQKGKLANLSDITVRYTEYNSGMSYFSRDKQLKYQYQILKKYWLFYPGKIRALMFFFKMIILYYLPVLRLLKK